MKKSELTKLIKECHEEILTEARNSSPFHKYVYFAFNYPNNWIEKIWEGNTHMIEHLNTKFNSAYSRYGSKAAMNMFYVDLDSDNQQIFEDWVMANYNG